jgi:hypothetical protein
MIKSAEEFVELRTSLDPEEYRRAAYDIATDEVWMDIVTRYPEMRRWVAHNQAIPLHILRVLARDLDPKVRFAVAMSQRTEQEVLGVLAADADSSVRGRVAQNQETPREVLVRLVNDPSNEVAEVARKRISDMNKHVTTGTWSLGRPDVAREHFGLVSAFGPTAEPGHVRITLDTRQVEVRAQGTFITIKLPEAWASVLVKHTSDTVVHLQHLRVLYKHEMLTDNALHVELPFNPPLQQVDERSLNAVNTRADLAMFVRILASALRAGKKLENADLQSFLDALAAWTLDMDSLYASRGEAPPEKPSWRLFAEMLLAATGYE